MFGHTLRSPLKILKDKLLKVDASPQENVLDYVSKFRERLHHSWAFKNKTLGESQKSMKQRYDRSAVSRCFAVGDQVLVLLPVPGSFFFCKIYRTLCDS